MYTEIEATSNSSLVKRRKNEEASSLQQGYNRTSAGVVVTTTTPKNISYLTVPNVATMATCKQLILILMNKLVDEQPTAVHIQHANNNER